MKRFVKKLIPPIIFDLFNTQMYGFRDNYKDWGEAERDASGYDSAIILEKVKAASLKVKRGEAAFERDSITFDKKEYSWNLLAPLLWITNANGNALNLFDFGGSLGSSYFQNLDFLEDIKDLSWNVVEQNHFVKAGKESFEDDRLHFFESLRSAKDASGKPDVVLFGSSLQYLKDPYQVLEETTDLEPEVVIIERTPFHNSTDTITLQKVPPRIYEASYPAWIFDIAKMKKFFLDRKYSFISESNEGSMPRNSSGSVELKELIFRKND